MEGNTTDSSNTLNSNTTSLVGWVLESPGRGTLTLITTCIITIFLCTWVVIHPRVENCKKARLAHKLILFFKTIVAPELIAVEGAQEWTQARRTIRQCRHLTKSPLRLTQAFYIGMLAVRYRTDEGTRVLWPNQFVWLLQEHLITQETYENWGLAIDNIVDKSNADATAKIFALWQVSWFFAQSIMRVVHKLPLAPLESMTLSYIPLFAITYFFWWVKPKDIGTPSEIDLPPMSEEQWELFYQLAVSNDFDEQRALKGWKTTVWMLTPRVFEKEARDKALQEAERTATSDADKRCDDQSVVTDEEIVLLRLKLEREKVSAHWDPELYHSRLWPVTCLFGASFGALHLISWNAIFPTIVELWLWRASAITSIVTLLVFMQFEKVVLKWNGPSTAIQILSPVLYLMSRIIMLAITIAAFRATDARVYQTYNVSSYWVHLM